jgi:outer membrane protein assembly factor BamB
MNSNEGSFYAFDRAGVIRWRCETGIPGPILCTPALAANNLVYFTQAWSTAVGPADQGAIFAVRASDGGLVWQYPIGWSSSSPALGSDALYACGDQNPDGGSAVLYAFRTF